MQPLSIALFREVRPDFFRVLAGPLAKLYADALDTLERGAARRNQGLDREEALALVEQAVEQHGELETAGDDAITQAGTMREKARVVLETLRQAGWLTEEQRSDWQRLMFFDASGAVLMQALRKIAFPDAAVFSDKLVNVCVTLTNHDALAAEPWAQVESCVANLESGLAELRAMQKSIDRHTRQQLAASPLKENLAVLYDQFAERIGRTCYAQLVHSSRLGRRVRGIENYGIHHQRLPIQNVPEIR